MLYLRPFSGFAGDIWSVRGGHLVSWRGTSGQFAGDIWSVRRGHLVSSRGTSGQFAGDIWSVAGGHLVSSQWTSGQFVRRAPKLVREAADTLFKGQKVSF